MDRTESMVVQVAPQYENGKIQEMQGFGWNLHGRQEVHQEGDAFGRPSFDGSSYIVKTKVQSYVKLHLARGLDLPYIDEIRRLEAEYFGQPFTSIPGMKAPGCFTLFGVVGILICAVMLGQHGAPGPFGVVMYSIWTLLGILWWRSRTVKRQKILTANTASTTRMGEIKREAARLLSMPS
jgi:hypothetical protein